MTGRLIVAIDGPAAAGKGTLARRIAQALDLPYLDTGLLYRAVGRLMLNSGHDPADAALAEQAAGALGEADLSRAGLRGPEADRAASIVAAHPGVRARLIAFQRAFGAARGAVLDGRDVGTVIFPDAPIKLFVTASDDARVRRRWLDLQERGVAADLAQVARDLRERDARDRTRGIAPLRPADDALLLDTTLLDADAAFTQAMRMIGQNL